jgi:hypothetical protein
MNRVVEVIEPNAEAHAYYEAILPVFYAAYQALTPVFASLAEAG